MKFLSLLNIEFYHNRSRHFFNSLIEHNHTIEKATPKPNESLNGYDCVFVDENSFRDWPIDIIRSTFDDYKGKLVFLALSDFSNTNINMFPEEIKKKSILATFIKYPVGHQFYFKNSFLLPRFTIDYSSIIKTPTNQRKNEMFFVGSLTGGYMFKGKNARVEAIKIIQQSSMSSKFNGWLTSPDNKIATKKRKPEYESTIHSLRNRIPREDYKNVLNSTTVSLCLPGNSSWGTRQQLSFQCGSCVISQKLINDPQGLWWCDHLFNKTCMTFKKDLSDLLEVCEHSIKDRKLQEEKIEQQNDAFQTYYAMTERNTYQDIAWNFVNNGFMECYNVT